MVQRVQQIGHQLHELAEILLGQHRVEIVAHEVLAGRRQRGRGRRGDADVVVPLRAIVGHHVLQLLDALGGRGRVAGGREALAAFALVGDLALELLHDVVERGGRVRRGVRVRVPALVHRVLRACDRCRELTLDAAGQRGRRDPCLLEEGGHFREMIRLFVGPCFTVRVAFAAVVGERHYTRDPKDEKCNPSRAGHPWAALRLAADF